MSLQTRCQKVKPTSGTHVETFFIDSSFWFFPTLLGHSAGTLTWHQHPWWSPFGDIVSSQRKCGHFIYWFWLYTKGARELSIVCIHHSRSPPVSRHCCRSAVLTWQNMVVGRRLLWECLGNQTQCWNDWWSFDLLISQLHLTVTSSPKEIKAGWFYLQTPLQITIHGRFHFMLLRWIRSSMEQGHCPCASQSCICCGRNAPSSDTTRLQAYISAQQRALTKTQRSCPSSWNSCMKSLTTCMGSQVSASWLAQTEREKDTTWHAPSHLAHSVRKCPVFQTHGLDCLQSLMVVHGYLGFFTIREVLWLESPETRSFDHLCFLSSPQCMLAIPSPRS